MYPSSSLTWIVDFDGTIINLDLGGRFSDWVYSSRRVKRFSPLLRVLGAPFNVCLRKLERGQLFRAWSWGLTKPELQLLIEEFLTYIGPEITLNDVLLERLRRDEKAVKILLTGCPQELVEAFLTINGLNDFDDVIGMTVSHGVMITRHPYGRSKTSLVSQYSSTIAVGDSWSDRFILGSAAQSIVIPGVKKLEKLAQKSGWEILNNS
jgi:phosphoserine phosphatase